MMGHARRMIFTVAAVIVATIPGAYAQDNPVARAAREWRQQHEPQLVAEYFEFLTIPNVSRDKATIRRNAEYLLKMMEKRGLKPRLLEVPDVSPVVYGEIVAPGATRTYVFSAIAHLGQ